MTVPGRGGLAPLGRAAPLLALSLRLLLHAAPVDAEAGGGGRCATGGEVARLRCQLDEFDLAVKAKDAELARKEATFELALEAKNAELALNEALVKAKDAELAQTKALVRELSAQLAQMKATIEGLRANSTRVEAEWEEALAEERSGGLEQWEDTELDRKEASAPGEDAPEVGRQRAPLLEDPANVSAQLLGKRYARAAEHVRGVAPRLDHGAGLHDPAPAEEARRVSTPKPFPSEGAATRTARPGTRQPARAEQPDDGRWRRGRPGRRLRAEATGTVITSWPGAWRARLGDRLSDAELWRRGRMSGRAVDEAGHLERDLAGQGKEHRRGAGPRRGDGRPDVRLTREERSGRLLAASDLPTIIAGLPDNTTRIDLPDMDLTGTLPEELGRLVDLEYLDLSGNRITGTLPAALFGLAKLQVMQLQQNQLTGPLPAQIGNMAAMVRLNISGNDMTGTLPNALCDMTKLANLSLAQCQLEGSVPSCLGSLPRLEWLDLWSNELSGTVPNQLGNLTRLTFLDLSENQLSGTIPPELGELTQLKYLYLYTNQLSGTIPPELGKLTQLTKLALSENQLTGPLPINMAALVKLVHLFLGGNGLTGTLPDELCDMTELAELSLNKCELEGTVPGCLGSLPRLEGLDLWTNQLSGTVPKKLGNLTQLTFLDLSENQLSGTMPPELGELTQLKYLYLSMNQLSGTIPPELGKLTQVTWLILNDNQFAGTIPKELGNLVNMARLRLGANELFGTIPPELGELTQLEDFLAQDNRLTGTVPKELGNIVNLKLIDLSTNQLSGTLPPELGNLVSLMFFSIQNNQLFGTIPEDYLGNFTRMQIFNVGGNQLSGAIPSSLSQWTVLSTLMIGNNRFSGTLPPELGSLSQLARLDVGTNLLTGTVPNELAGRLVNLSYVDLSRNNFTGTLPEWIGQLQALQALYVHENPHLRGTFPDTTLCTGLFQIMAQGCGFTSAGAVGGSVQVVSFARNAFAELPTAWVDLPAVRQLDLSDNHISAWRPYGVLQYGTFSDGVWFCGVTPLQTRLNWPAVESVDLSGNPFGRATTARDFIWSLAYLPRLSELRAARCQLQGGLPYEGPFFSVDMENTGFNNCSDGAVRRDGFPALFSLDLSENNLSSVMSYPPTRLHMAALHSNALWGLSSRWWYSLSGTLEVWNNTLLRADVLPPSREGGCPTAGAPILEADPLGWVTQPGHDFQCTGLCTGTEARYKHDGVLNASSLCRCTEGRQGSAMNCTGCPADTYSHAQDEFAMLRTCRPCPEGSSTDGVENATGFYQCKCPAGWYMQAPPAGPANKTDNGTAAAPACARCKQRQFMDTEPGATKEDECACSRSYDGLRAVLGVCGCADGLYMDHLARACKQCDAVAERCTWGSAVDQSLRPPVVEAAYWAALAPEAGPDEASNFSQHDIWRCFSRDTCKGDGVCAPGRSGTACSLCDAGMYGGPDGPCHPCPGSPEQSRRALLYGLLIGPAATLAAHMALQSSAESTGVVLGVANLRTSLKQSVKYLQMLGVLSTFHVNWPPLARQFLTDIPRITVALPQLAGVACLAGQQSASLEMGFRWLLPVAGLSSACLSALVLLPVRRCCRKRCWHQRLRMSHWDVLRVCLWGLTLFFSTLLQFGTQVLTCAPSPNGLRTVLTFPHLACGGTGEWARLAVMSSVFLLVFVVAVFLGVYAAWRHTAHTLVDTAFRSRGWWGFLFNDLRSGWGHWVLLSMAKDTALVAIATAGASDGPSQLLATMAGAVLYSYAVLRDQPFRDSSNSLLEAWTAMSVAVLAGFAAGMGYPGSPDLADVAELYPGGADNSMYKRRERALLVLQWLTFAGPLVIMLCQLLGMFHRARRMVPSFLQPRWDEKERAEWNEDFVRRLNLDAASRDFRGVMERFDAVDHAKFRHLMSTSLATLGLIRGSARGISGLVRRRFSDAARSSELFQEALRNSTGDLSVLQTNAGTCSAQKEGAAAEQAQVVHPQAENEGGSPQEPEDQGNDPAWAGKEEVGMAVPACQEVRSGIAVKCHAVREKRIEQL